MYFWKVLTWVKAKSTIQSIKNHGVKKLISVDLIYNNLTRENIMLVPVNLRVSKCYFPQLRKGVELLNLPQLFSKDSWCYCSNMAAGPFPIYKSKNNKASVTLRLAAQILAKHTSEKPKNLLVSSLVFWMYVWSIERYYIFEQLPIKTDIPVAN